MILSFEEYCNNEWTTDFDIVNESMSISIDVEKETEKIVDLINSSLNGPDIKKEDDGSLKFIKNPVVKIFDCDCELDFTFVNYLKRGTIAHCDAKLDEKNGISYTIFFLKGYIQIENGKVSEICAAIIGHELRHSYILQKMYNNVPILSAKKRYESEKKWSEIYNSALSYIDKAYADKDRNYSESILDLMIDIYYSDVTEVAAFTQEAYENCKKCKTVSEVKNKIKDTTLYKMKESFKIILDDMDYLMKHHKNQYEKFYNKRKQMIDECSKLPSAHQLQKLCTKGYNKVLSNIGKVISYIKYELEDKDTVKTVIEKY